MTAKRYWDSCAFLAWLQNEADRVDACRDTIEQAKRGEVLLVTSALTVAEVLWIKEGPRLTSDKATLLNRFFRRSYIRVVNVDRATAERSQSLVWADGIRPKDAIHVATALKYQCDVLETFDGGLIGKSGQCDGLLIREPLKAAQSSLDI
jgi:predicted nucleic acid-binding protein